MREDEENKKEPEYESEESQPKVKANQDALDVLHGQVTKVLTKQMRKKDPTPQEIAQAIKFLKDNNVVADIEFNKGLKDLGQVVDKNVKVDVNLLPFPINKED